MSTFNESAWRKSSYSSAQGQCVEVAWRKSSYSGSQGQCVEVAAQPDAFGVRDTKNRDGGHLDVPAASWGAFLREIKDVPAS